MKKSWKISFLITTTFLVFLSCWNYRNRVFDWDMPGYIGCLYSFKFPSQPDKVHALTYQDIRKEAPELQYKDITGLQEPADKARQAFAYNIQAFHEQLPYYKVKIGYNIAVMLLYTFGLTSPQAVLLLSAISYFVSGLLFLYLMKIIFPGNYFLAGSITFAVMLCPPVMQMARIPTPDMFLFQFMLLFIIALLNKWNQWTVFTVLIIIILTRPDYTPFVLSYIAMEACLKYYSTGKFNFYFFLQGILPVLLYLAIIRLCHYPGWKDLFYDTFIYRRPVISAQPPDFSCKEYLDILLVKIMYFKKITLISILLSGLTYYFSKDLRTRLFSVLLFLNIYIKFIFFPHSAEMRFFFIFIIMLFVVLLHALSEKYNGFRLRKIA